MLNDRINVNLKNKLSANTKDFMLDI